MDEQAEVYLLLSTEVRQLLSENQIDLADELRQRGIDVRKRFAQDPTQETAAGSRELVTVLVVSVALIAALTPAITQIISSMTHKSPDVEAYDLAPVVDPQGNVVKDATGEPVLYWKKRDAAVLQSAQAGSEHSFTLEGPLGLKLSASSKINQ